MKTRLSTKGQLSIPKEVRERHGWEPGTEFQVEDRADSVVLRPVTRFPETTLEELAGCARYDGPRRSLEDMEAAVAQGAEESR